MQPFDELRSYRVFTLKEKESERRSLTRVETCGGQRGRSFSTAALYFSLAEAMCIASQCPTMMTVIATTERYKRVLWPLCCSIAAADNNGQCCADGPMQDASCFGKCVSSCKKKAHLGMEVQKWVRTRRLVRQDLQALNLKRNNEATGLVYMTHQTFLAGSRSNHMVAA